jgi:acyl transferase domain-containing protein
LTALQWTIVGTLAQHGIEPDAVIGLSLGELTAAAVAGALSVDDALFIAEQAELAQRRVRAGKMAVVDLSASDADDFLRDREDVWVSVELASGVTVISGTLDAVDSAVRDATSLGIGVSEGMFPFAYHTEAMLPAREAFLSAISRVVGSPPRIPISSGVTGSVLELGALEPIHWWRALAERLRFHRALATLMELGVVRIIEIGPVPMLTGIVRRTAADLGLQVEHQAALELLPR